MPASYLIRFDDITQTMNWKRWAQIEDLLREYDIRPLIAVVPDNRDPKLQVDSSHPNFWGKIRELQGRGYYIGLHGFQHVYKTQDAGLLKLNRFSEFSGVALGLQLEMITRGLQIFSREGVRADCWAAPAHSFDGSTLKALRSAGISTVSDGFAFYPAVDSEGLLWIPQQLWRFYRVPAGVWTVCFHHNHWTDTQFDAFRSSIRNFAPRIRSFQEITQVPFARSAQLLNLAYPARLQRLILRLRKKYRALGS